MKKMVPIGIPTFSPVLLEEEGLEEVLFSVLLDRKSVNIGPP